MPYFCGYADAEEFMTHRCVAIFCAYKDDDFDSGRLEYWYGLTPDCSFQDGTVFDVRETAAALGMSLADRSVQDVLRAAVDRALEGRAAEAGKGFATCWEYRTAVLQQVR